MPDPLGDAIEEIAIDTMKRAEQYLGHYNVLWSTNPAKIAWTARSAMHDFQHTDYWILSLKAQETGAIIIVDAASSASAGITMTTTGSPRIDR